MLAATIAFTPVVGAGVVNQNTVSAATQTVDKQIDQLASRFYIFYQSADETALRSAYGKASNLTYSDIEEAAKDLSISLNIPSDKQDDFATLMQNVATLIYTKYNSAESLAYAVTKFRTVNATYFNALFDEDGQVTADQLIAFISAMESNLEKAIALNALSSNAAYEDIVSDAVAMTFDGHPGEFDTLKGKLSGIGLSVEKLFKLQGKLNDEVLDPNKTARSSMLQSAFKVKGASINEDSDGYYLKVPYNGMIVEISNSIQWETSDSSIAHFTGNKLTVKKSGTITVYAKLDGMTLATKSVTVQATGGNSGGSGGSGGSSGGSGGGTSGGGSRADLPSKTETGNGKITIGKDVAKVETKKNENGQTEKVVSVDATKVADIVKNLSSENKELALPLGRLVAGEVAKAQLPAKLFTESVKKEAEAVVTVATNKAAYKISAKELNDQLQALAQRLGVSNAEDLTISIAMSEVDKQESASKYKVNIVSNVVEFHVEVSANGKTEQLTRFSQYVDRELTGDKVFDPNHSVALRLNEDGTFVSLPTLFNDKTATVKSLTNSAYTIVENDKTFPDVDNNKNWAEKYIETLASKYIIKGKTNGLYAPQDYMTRAQFTVLLVRALGLPSEQYDGRFKDVKGDEWFNANGELMAAVKHGIIRGKLDGTFAPNEQITRAQAAVMIERTMNLGLLNYDMSQLNPDKKVTDFKDEKQIGTWARTSVEKVYQAGILTGKNDGRFDPNGYLKRDQMAKLLAEFLISAKLMNDIQ
ncbi:S-layer family protein [Anoxybacillus vitaminiphilus]|uniref:S-layer family protein n=2 Tax=Paranoxybacillus vitaminiphilus TaxID=581036 RepID=A0A327YHG8_9BACL|nr:S-layer family protein [Anoxybacillus vitaminiphilus]